MKIKINNLNLSQIADSGQCFRWHKIGDDFYEVIAFDRYITVKQTGNEFCLSCDEGDWRGIWSSYLDMDTDYDRVASSIEESDDDYLKEAFRHGRGIRILRQDLWETLISFIISQNNNIKRIRSSIEAICAKAALPVINNGPLGKYRFPKPGEVDGDFFIDRELGLGYRDTYLAEMYEYAHMTYDFPEKLKSMDNREAFLLLKSFKGIGDKVANCVCLFGLHQIDAFPIDTHIKQILNTYYPNGFDFDRYKGYEGIVQQYMFNYKVNKGKI